MTGHWTQILVALMYLLGFVGVAAVTLIPLRIAGVIRYGSAYWSKGMRGRAAFVSFGVVSLLVVYVEISVIIQIFQCLTELRCGPSRTSGWQAFAGLGFSYAVLEVARFMAFSIAGLESNGSRLKETPGGKGG